MTLDEEIIGALPGDERVVFEHGRTGAIRVPPRGAKRRAPRVAAGHEPYERRSREPRVALKLQLNERHA